MVIRDFAPADAPAWVALWNAVLGRNTTAGRLLADLERDGGKSRLWVAQGAGGLCGLAQLNPSPFAPAGYLQARLAVAPGARGQGVGQRLADTLLTAAQKAGAAGLTAEVADNDPISLAWAERRGFAVQLQRFASELNLKTFEAGPFAADLHRLEAQGLAFRDLQGASDAEMQAYLNFVADLLTDTPDLRGHPRWPLDEVARLLHIGVDARPDWLLLVVSPTGEWLGTTAMIRYGDTAYNEFTAVRPASRGHGLALPLKLRAIALAQQEGLAVMRTNNHSRNAPMLAVNGRLGFVQQVGKYELHRAL